MRFLSLQLVTPPTAEPVSLALAKQHLRVDYPDDDGYIPVLITAAREWCENYMQRRIFNQTWTRTLDYFPIWIGGTTVNPSNRDDWMYFSDYWSRVMIQLPGQIQSVNSITYMLPNGGGTQTLDPSTYVADLTSIPARLVPQQGMTWPVQTLYAPGSVQIEYVAGSWGDGVTVNTCPQSVVYAMLLLIRHWYDNRSAVTDQNLKDVPMAVQALLSSYKMQSFAIS
jgi:uncharacterized phiE125 gp8 family phage protein